MGKVYEKNAVAIAISKDRFSIINKHTKTEEGTDDADSVEFSYSQYEDLKTLLLRVEEKIIQDQIKN